MNNSFSNNSYALNEALLNTNTDKIQQLWSQKINIYRYEINNIDTNINDIVIEENTIQILNLSSETKLECVILSEDFTEQPISNYDSPDGTIIKTLNNIQIIIKNNILLTNKVYLYTFKQFVEKSDQDFFYLQNSSQKIQQTKETIQTLFLNNILNLKVSKNSKFIFTKQNFEEIVNINKLEIITPISSLIGSIKSDGIINVFNKNENSSINWTPQTKDNFVPFYLNPTENNEKLLLYSPWLDKNRTIPLVIFDSSDANNITLDDLFTDSTIKQLLKKIIVWTFIYTSNADGVTNQKLIEKLTRIGTNLSSYVSSLLNNELLKNPSIRNSTDYQTLKAVLCSLSKIVLSQYAYNGGLNDASTYLNPWYLELTDGQLSDTIINNSFDTNTGDYQDDTNFVPIFQLKSIYFVETDLCSNPQKITNKYFNNISVPQNIFSDTTAFAWSDIDNPIDFFNGTTLAQDINNAKNLSKYLFYVPFSDSFNSNGTQKVNTGATNLFLDWENTKAKTYSNQFKKEYYPNQPTNQQILEDAKKEFNVPPNATNIQLLNVVNVPNEKTIPFYGCKSITSPTPSCPVNPSDAEKTKPKPCITPLTTAFERDCKYTYYEVSATLTYEISNGNKHWSFGQKLLTAYDFNYLLTRLDDNLSNESKKFTLIPYFDIEPSSSLQNKSPDFILSSLKNIYIRGIFGGNFAINIIGEDKDGKNKTISLGNINDPQNPSLRLYNLENENVTLTRIRF